MQDTEYANESGYFHLDGSLWCGTVGDHDDGGLCGDIASVDVDEYSGGWDDVGDDNNDIPDDIPDDVFFWY